MVLDEHETEWLDVACNRVFLVEVVDAGHHDDTPHTCQALDHVLHFFEPIVTFQDELGRAQCIVARIAAEAHARVLPLRRERNRSHLAGDELVSCRRLLHVLNVFDKRSRCLVSLFRLNGHERLERMEHFVVSRPFKWDDLVDLHLASGDGAGLVEADHVDARERLDAVDLLHEDTMLRQTENADGKHRTGEQNQALGNHADERRRRVQGGARHVSMRAEQHLLAEQQDAQRNERDADVFHDDVERLHDVASHFLVRLSIVVDMARIVIGADSRDARDGLARHDERAGHQLVTRLLRDDV